MRGTHGIPTHKAGSVTNSVMRKVVHIAAGLFLIACGPDPNALLPGQAAPSTSGGARVSGGVTTSLGGAGGAITGNGGVTSNGGSTVVASGGVVNPFVGGAPGTNGGIVSSGGTVGSGGVVSSGGTTTSPFGNGGLASGGGVVSSGGVTSTGGDTSAGGSSGTDDGGSGSEPCVPAKTITGTGSGNSGNFGTTGEFCFRTPDNITGWNCSNFTGRTLKVNGVTTTCGAASLPAKVNGYYYFDATAGGVDYASIYWY
jgi:hypothetical protein